MHVQQLLRVVVGRGRAGMALSTICLVLEAVRTANEHMCYMMHVGDEREGASDGREGTLASRYHVVRMDDALPWRGGTHPLDSACQRSVDVVELVARPVGRGRGIVSSC